MNDTCCVREFRTKAEVEAAQFREGLIAYEHGYDLQNVLSLSKIGQETYWKLRLGEEEES
jgi:hypothetical protein